MIAGAALLVLAAWSPFALLRLIPMMEIAAASVVSQRSSMSGAAQSAGISDAGHVHAPGDGPPLASVSFARLARRGRHDLQPRRVERRPILGSPAGADARDESRVA